MPTAAAIAEFLANAVLTALGLSQGYQMQVTLDGILAKVSSVYNYVYRLARFLDEKELPIDTALNHLYDVWRWTQDHADSTPPPTQEPPGYTPPPTPIGSPDYSGALYAIEQGIAAIISAIGAPSETPALDAAGVWGYALPTYQGTEAVGTMAAGEQLGKLPVETRTLTHFAQFPVRSNSDFAVWSNGLDVLGDALWNGLPSDGPLTPPRIDWTQWNGSETMAEFLARCYGEITWLKPFGGDGEEAFLGYPILQSEPASWYVLKWRTPDLPLLSGRLYQPRPVSWPGFANVTLGEPLDIADGMAIAGPLDGVLIEIASVPPGTGRYAYGSILSYTHVLSILFGNDDGEGERAQTLGLQLEVVTPKTITRPSGAVIRLERAIHGTVRPWLSRWAP